MKIIIEVPHEGEDEQIIVKCHRIDPALLDVLNTIKAGGGMLIAHIGNEIHRVNPSDIYYIESVDNKTFLYGKREVYESKQKLYELEESAMRDFLRISKSVIVNMSKIKYLVPALSGRLEAVLTNGEKVIISRQYVQALKKSLGM